MADPTTDCPPCPGCGMPLGTPVTDEDGGMTTDRWDGPADATCWCPSCGCGWVASPADLARAQRSLAAYNARLDSEVRGGG